MRLLFRSATGTRKHRPVELVQYWPLLLGGSLLSNREWKIGKLRGLAMLAMTRKSPRLLAVLDAKTDLPDFQNWPSTYIANYSRQPPSLSTTRSVF